MEILNSIFELGKTFYSENKEKRTNHIKFYQQLFPILNHYHDKIEDNKFNDEYENNRVELMREGLEIITTNLIEIISNSEYFFNLTSETRQQMVELIENSQEFLRKDSENFYDWNEEEADQIIDGLLNLYTDTKKALCR